jgi:DNA polymerase I-like protein with 3'-5' exonuclease and polymerase domains
MRTTFFDIETDGFLQHVTKIHCLSIKNPANGRVRRFTAVDMEEGVRLLMKLGETGKLVGHNIIGFDIAVIQKLYPWFQVPLANVVDTLVLSRLFFSDMFNRDGGFIKAGKLPGKLIGSHKLEAWGYRLGLQKGEYSTDFKNTWIDQHVTPHWVEYLESLPLKKRETADPAAWTAAWGKEHYPEGLEWAVYCPEMGDYCDLDVEVTEALYDHLMKLEYSDLAIELEHKARHYCSMMERSGWPFNVEHAVALYAKLAQERDTIRARMMATFPPLVIERTSEKTGKRLKDKVIEFNPASRDQIAQRLKAKYGWEPKEFTEGGKAKVDEDILKKLPYEEAQILADYFLLEKRVGQIAEGDQAWLKLERSGHIHGSINTNGAVTGRCTHSQPNVAQVPSVKLGKVEKPDGTKEEVPLLGKAGGWGVEMRSLYTVRKGFKQVGADLSGIELRCLAHFMARWDGGAYGEVILNGDIHTENQKAAGLPTRANAKTFIYAFLYGAGDEKIGSITGRLKGMVIDARGKEVEKLLSVKATGAMLKAKFLAGLPALKKLKEAVEKKAKAEGYILGLDGRRLTIRSAHAALNTLLQGAGAAVAKRWLIEVFEEAERRGLKYGWDADWTLLGWVHDEFQMAVREGLEEDFGKMVVECAARAGEFFKFRCPVGAEYKIGANWCDTH